MKTGVRRKMSVESEAAISDPGFFFWDKQSLREIVLRGGGAMTRCRPFRSLLPHWVSDRKKEKLTEEFRKR